MRVIILFCFVCFHHVAHGGLTHCLPLVNVVFLFDSDFLFSWLPIVFTFLFCFVFNDCLPSFAFFRLLFIMASWAMVLNRHMFSLAK